MSNQHVARPVALSHYRQMKLLVTQHGNGALDYRIYGKRLEDGWQERHLLVADSLRVPPFSVLTTEHVAECLRHVIREQFLPGID